MFKLLSTPLLPESKVKTVFMSDEYTELTTKLNKEFDIDVISVTVNPKLDSSISRHADCALVQIDDSLFIGDSTNYNNIVNYLTIKKGEYINSFSMIPIKEEVNSPYPGDVKLNIKVIDDRIICNSRFISAEINEYTHEKHIEHINVKQGYSACSCVVLNNKALITDDESICLSSVTNGIDTLLINKGSVKLNGYNYGFIGGTCGMIDNNLIAFTGNLETHTDCDRIISFLNKHNVKYSELSDGPLVDIGGIIPLFEYC